jgi:hypothetical protein
MKRRKIEEKAKADDASSKEKDAEKRKRVSFANHVNRTYTSVHAQR